MVFYEPQKFWKAFLCLTGLTIKPSNAMRSNDITDYPKKNFRSLCCPSRSYFPWTKSKFNHGAFQPESEICSQIFEENRGTCHPFRGKLNLGWRKDKKKNLKENCLQVTSLIYFSERRKDASIVVISKPNNNFRLISILEIWKKFQRTFHELGTVNVL